MMYGNGWSWMLPMALCMTVFIAAVVVVLVATARSGVPASRGRTPEDILRKRFARGEIDATQYRQRIDTLQSR